MIRRSFRLGLWLGLLGGLAYAVLRIVQANREPSVVPAATAVPTEPWPRLDVEPARPTVAPAPLTAPAPVAAPVVEEVAPANEAPAPPAPVKKATPKKVLAPWVDPKGGICPKAHPVKAKLSSKIFQVPGNFAYDRTNPDRCYKDAKTAANDGFRAAKR